MNERPLPAVGELLSRTSSFYRRYLGTIVLVTLPIVAFVELVVGAGLGELTASVHRKFPVADLYIGLAAEAFVVVPLVTVSLARAVVIDASRAGTPTARQVVEDALDLFVPALAVVLAVLLGVAVGIVVLLVVPGVYLAVSWYFAVQAVAIDDRRGFAAISLSAELVRGRWWQTAIVGGCFALVLLFGSLLPQEIFYALAVAANSYAFVIASAIVVDTLVLPFVAIGSTLYYLALRERAGLPAPRLRTR